MKMSLSNGRKFELWRLGIEQELKRWLACLKLCEGCGVPFVDTTKNGSKKWCSPTTCGNRAKVRAHRDRKAKKG